MKLRSALFDFDGTLVSSDPIHLAVWNRLLGEYGYMIDTDFYSANCSGEGSIQIAEKIKQNFQNISFDPKVFAQTKDACYEQWISTQTIPCMPGAGEILEFLKTKGVAIGLVTSAPLSGVTRTLTGNKISQYFDSVVTRECVSRGKPAPDGYLFALNQLGVDADQAMAFEDTCKGIKAAKAAHLFAFAIPNKFTLNHDFSLADTCCQNLEEAKNLLAQWFAE